jgi:hypothetical protein
MDEAVEIFHCTLTWVALRAWKPGGSAYQSPIRKQNCVRRANAKYCTIEFYVESQSRKQMKQVKQILASFAFICFQDCMEILYKIRRTTVS